MPGFDVSSAGGFLTLSGELDLAAAPQMVKVGLAALNDEEVHALVVDLMAVTFIDSTALSALIELANTARKLTKKLTMINSPARVQRIAQITGLTDLFGLTAGNGQTG